ncbi:MAG: DUF3810 domain-containing protein [Lachnospiraceae bacterium]|nr:DUF3810 domain-containing protein [Lachnospiraceae bacterium]
MSLNERKAEKATGVHGRQKTDMKVSKNKDRLKDLPEKPCKRGKKVLIAVDLILLLLILLVNLLAWNFTAFCDWYVKYIYPVLAVNIWSRLFSIFPFSMGEWLIVVAVIVLSAGILLAVACAIRFVIKNISGVLRRKTANNAVLMTDVGNVSDSNTVSVPVSDREAEIVTDTGTMAEEEQGNSSTRRIMLTLPRFTRALWNFILTVALFTVLLMTVNYFILYHTTGFAGEYLTEGDHSEEQLLAVYNMLAEKCNELSEVFERDEDGNILYDGDLEETAKAAMRTLGNTYPQLSGYYPTAKKIYFSNLFSQEYLMGIVFPYTMEANYNRIMYVTNKPFAICHELAHIKGYIREDEANFLSYLACIGSDDELFRYSAYLEMYTYVINDAYKNYDIYSGIWEDAVRVNATVTADNVFLKAETWAEVEENAVVSTETVKEVSNTLNDANLKMNGVESGMVSYSEVVELLLDYYTENELE